MGIEAFCPNGHRVKVKDALAGKKGLCPTCGTAFRIPEPQAPGGLPEARPISVAPSVVATLPRATPLAAGGRAGPAPVDHGAAAAPSVTSIPPSPQPEPGWYVALPGQTPSGPVPAARVAEEVAAGRHPAVAVVWREGWPDWKPIGDFFPVPAVAAARSAPAVHIPIGAEPEVAAEIIVEAEMDASAEDASGLPRMQTRRVIRKRSSGPGVAVSLLLLVVVAAAAAAAWHVLRTRGIIR